MIHGKPLVYTLHASPLKPPYEKLTNYVYVTTQKKKKYDNKRSTSVNKEYSDLYFII